MFAAIAKVDPDTFDFGPAKGDLFSFDFKVDKDELTISDLRGTKGGDEAKRHVEGAYAKKK